jgi:hypothetical protein
MTPEREEIEKFLRDTCNPFQHKITDNVYDYTEKGQHLFQLRCIGLDGFEICVQKVWWREPAWQGGKPTDEIDMGVRLLNLNPTPADSPHDWDVKNPVPGSIYQNIPMGLASFVLELYTPEGHVHTEWTMRDSWVYYKSPVSGPYDGVKDFYLNARVKRPKGMFEMWLEHQNRDMS